MLAGSTQIGGDGPPYYPMARAIAGGLAFSTVVSLLFLPTIYAMLDDLGSATSGILKRARDAAPLQAAPDGRASPTPADTARRPPCRCRQPQLAG